MNIKDSANTCEKCYYYKADSSREGQCRNSRPVVNSKGRTIWPWVGNDDWCGKWVGFVTREEMDNYKGKA